MADESHLKTTATTCEAPRKRKLLLRAREKSLIQGHVLSDFKPIFESDGYFLARCVRCGADCFVCLDNPPGFEVQGRAVVERCLRGGLVPASIDGA